MPTTTVRNPETLIRDRDSFGLSAWRGLTPRMSWAHVHHDIEWNFVIRGSMHYFLGGRFRTIPQGSLGLFWGGIPHRLVRTGPGPTEVIWVTVPLAWFMQWDLSEVFTRRLLSGELLQDRSASSFDRAMLQRWVEDLKSRSLDARRTVMLEVEAKLRRLAAAHGSTPTRRAPREPAGGNVERLARYVGQHYREPLSIAQIAAVVDLHPNYAMQLFKRGCGMSLWEYLTRLRVSHAQRLLLTTDWKLHRVALESGFGSPGRFYESFNRICNTTPRKYRKSMTM